MSVDLYLYSKSLPPKRAVERVILPRGFVETERSNAAAPHYFWFEDRDLQSMRGCHFWIFRVKPGDGWSAPAGTRTIFDAKTYIGRSREDVEMQNGVMRELKKAFGGTLYNDAVGSRGYVPNEVPRLSYAEKRCGLVFVSAKESVWRARALPTDPPPQEAQLAESLSPFGIVHLPQATLANNCVVPFVVAILEQFLRALFVAFIDSQPLIAESIYEKQAKLEYRTLKELLEGRTTLAQQEADGYSFQNIQAASAAYERYLGLNLFRIWGVRKRHGDRFLVVRDVLGDLIELRHRIIHRGHIDPTLSKDSTLTYLRFVEHAFDLVAAALLRERKFRIDLEEYL